MKKYKNLIIFLFLAPILLCAFFLVTDFFLKKHTNHNQLISLPNLLGKTFQEVHNTLNSLNLNYQLVDKNIRDYNPNFQIGAVTSQDPYPGEKVKEGRSIYLTLNAEKIPLTAFPNISDKPFRYAKSILESVNLKVGKIFYKNDIAENVILKSEFDGFLIKKSDSIPIFSSVDLYIGTGDPRNQFQFKVPKLEGLLFQDAENLLKENFLNLGDIYIDGLVSDSLNLIVYKQSRRSTNTIQTFYFSSKAKAPSVDVWLTNDISKINN